MSFIKTFLMYYYERKYNLKRGTLKQAERDQTRSQIPFDISPTSGANSGTTPAAGTWEQWKQYLKSLEPIQIEFVCPYGDTSITGYYRCQVLRAYPTSTDFHGEENQQKAEHFVNLMPQFFPTFLHLQQYLIRSGVRRTEVERLIPLNITKGATDAWVAAGKPNH